MSLVGPAAHLLDSDTWRQNEISAWCFARKPGLTGPSQLLGGAGEEALGYDRYYGRHASWQLDLDALRKALPRLIRGSAEAGASSIGPEERHGSVSMTHDDEGEGGYS
jgi:lipopolysaccharide/colanic/teichoic acid biosynthesis glycosyltransferase